VRRGEGIVARAGICLFFLIRYIPIDAFMSQGPITEVVELVFVHAGVMAELVKEGFPDFLGEGFAGGAGFDQGLAVDHDARREIAGSAAFMEIVADVEAQGCIGFFLVLLVFIAREGVGVGFAGAIFDDDGDLVEPLGELGGEIGDGLFDEAVEGFAGDVEHGIVTSLNRQVVKS
jgi:hypothetical protein